MPIPTGTAPRRTGREPPTEQDLEQLRAEMRLDAAYLAALQAQHGHPFQDTNARWSTEDTDAA